MSLSLSSLIYGTQTETNIVTIGQQPNIATPTKRDNDVKRSEEGIASSNDEPQKKKIKYDYENENGEYLMTNKSGDLGIYDEKGLITSLKRIK